MIFKRIKRSDNESMKANVILFIVVLALLLSMAKSYAAETKDSLPALNSKSQEITPGGQPGMTITVLIPLISAILGGLAGAGISVFFSRRQTKQEYRSLILSFCSEMVTVFQRCVTYYKQGASGEISYSALFSFTDSSALSKLASVCKKPEVVAAIVELKSMYFQIERHVEETARYAVEINRISDPREKDQIRRMALHAQGTALAFFRSYYDRIEIETRCIVQAAKQVSPGRVAEELYSRFSEAKEKKRNLDAQYNDS